MSLPRDIHEMFMYGESMVKAWWMDPKVQADQDDYGRRMNEVWLKPFPVPAPLPAIEDRLGAQLAAQDYGKMFHAMIDVKEECLEAGQKPLDNAQLMVEVLKNHPEWSDDLRQQFVEYMDSNKGAQYRPRLRNTLSRPALLVHPKIMDDLKGATIKKRKGHVPNTGAAFNMGGIEIHDSLPMPERVHEVYVVNGIPTVL